MSKIFLASTFATLLCASLAAQATQTPSPSPSSPAVSQQPAGGGGAPQTTAPPQAAPRAAAKADTISVEGCIQRSASATATTGATGTAGSAASESGFMLMSAAKPAGTSGASAGSAPIASSYRLDAADSKLSPHVGHKVEISGTVEPAGASASAAAAPKLKVDNVKMIAATCTP